MKENIFEYNGSKITFQLGDGTIMVNATEMAKPFDKQPVHFLNLNSTYEYRNALVKLKNLSLTDLMTVTRGGLNPGTWLHQDMALEFARWLNPEFSVWCNQKIMELLTKGTVSIVKQFSLPQTFSEALQLAADQAKQIELQQKEIKQLEPKAKVYEQLSDSTNLISIGDAAKALNIGIGRNTLFRKLRNMKILMAGESRIPYQDYVTRGYFTVKMVPVVINGDVKNIPTTYLTGRGLTWLSKIFNQ